MKNKLRYWGPFPSELINVFDMCRLRDTKNISRWTGFKLFFKRKEYYTIDGPVRQLVTYKELGGKTYILDISDLPPHHPNCRCITSPVEFEKQMSQNPKEGTDEE